MEPHSLRYFFLYRLIPPFYYLLRLYLSSLKMRVIGEEIALGCLADYGKVIVAVYHQRFLLALAYVTKFRNFEPLIMTSRSRDGELGARLAQRLGLEPVRGSSSKGGTTALATILQALRVNPAVIHIVDGPRGPKGIVKPGLVTMAQVSGAAILPVIVAARKAWILGSWDRFMIPKPFSEVTIEWGPPFVVQRDADPARLEEIRKHIEKKLSHWHAHADIHSGWTQPL